MEYKLNSMKTYKDNVISFFMGGIVVATLILAIGCWGYNEKAESETETAGTAELRTPGKLVEDELGLHQEMPPIQADTPHERFKKLCEAYGLDASTIRKVEDHYRVTEGVIACITVAETSGGNRGYGDKNIGSVGSNDRGDRPTYALMEAGLEAIGKTLNNRYLGNIQTLGCLSNGGHCPSWDNKGYRYATSDGNWEKNMVSCLGVIYGKIDPSTFNIRER